MFRRRFRPARFAPRLERLERRDLLAAASPIVAPAVPASHVAVADVNGDGFADLAVISPAPKTPPPTPAGQAAAVKYEDLTILLNDQKGGFAAAQTLTTVVPAGPRDTVAFGDLNNDGLPDLAVAGPDGHGSIIVEMFLDDGTPVRATAHYSPVLNGDGSVMTEKITLHHEGLYFGEPPALFLADVNGDGRADLVLTEGNQLAVVPSETAPPVAAAGTVSSGPLQFGPALVANNPLYQDSGKGGVNPFYEEKMAGVADLNGDGHADLVAVSGNKFLTASIAVSSSVSATGQTQSSLSFGTVNSIEIPGKPNHRPFVSQAFVADVNGDGIPDLVAVFGNEVFVGIGGKSAGAAATTYTWTVDTLPPRVLGYQGRLLLGDIDGDGKADLFSVTRPAQGGKTAADDWLAL